MKHKIIGESLCAAETGNIVWLLLTVIGLARRQFVSVANNFNNCQSREEIHLRLAFASHKSHMSQFDQNLWQPVPICVLEVQVLNWWAESPWDLQEQK